MTDCLPSPLAAQVRTGGGLDSIPISPRKGAEPEMNRYLRVVRFLRIPFVDLIQQVGFRENWWGGESEFGIREGPRTMGLDRF